MPRPSFSTLRRARESNGLNFAGATFFVGFVAVAGQRIGIPVGGLLGPGSLAEELMITLPLVALLLLYVGLLLFGGWRVSSPGLALWLALAALGLLSSVLNLDASIPSLMVLLVCYLPLLLLGSSDAGAVLRPALGLELFKGAVAAIKVGASLALVQVALQRTGQRDLWDPIGRLPDSMVVQEYHTVYTVAEGTALEFTKPNGIIFLEPSLVSLYSALGLVWLGFHFLTEGRRGTTDVHFWRWTVVFGLALISSVSTSGLVILAFASLPLLAPMLKRPAVAFLGICLLGASAVFGLMEPFVEKATEGFGAQTGTGLRLVVPYQALGSYVAEMPWYGYGPGTSDILADQLAIRGLQVPTALKATLEYGYLGTVLLLLAALLVLHIGRPPAPLALAVVVAWLLPAEALLNPTLVSLYFFGIANWPRRPPWPLAGRVAEQSMDVAANGAARRWSHRE